MKRSLQIAVLAAVVLSLVLSAGCGTSSKEERTKQKEKCKKVMLVYAKDNSSSEVTDLWISDLRINGANTQAEAIVRGRYSSTTSGAGKVIEPAAIIATRKGDTWTVLDMGTSIERPKDWFIKVKKTKA